METSIALVLTAFLLISGYIVYLKHKFSKIDHDIESFYKSIDLFRGYIHNCSSAAEAKELEVDIEHLELDYEDKVSSVVLSKEIDLLRTLLAKKMKKVRESKSKL